MTTMTSYFRDFSHSSRLKETIHNKAMRAVKLLFPEGKYELKSRVHVEKAATSTRSPIYLFEFILNSPRLRAPVIVKKSGENINTLIRSSTNVLQKLVEREMK